MVGMEHKMYENRLRGLELLILEKMEGSYCCLQILMEKHCFSIRNHTILLCGRFFQKERKAFFIAQEIKNGFFFHQLKPNFVKFSIKQGKLSLKLEQNIKSRSRTLAIAK